MRENEFEIFLGSKGYTLNSLKYRMSKARKAEQLLGASFDSIVVDDEKMYDALNELQKYDNPAHNPLQNALRRYYEFVNKKEFPQKRDFR